MFINSGLEKFQIYNLPFELIRMDGTTLVPFALGTSYLPLATPRYSLDPSNRDLRVTDRIALARARFALSLGGLIVCIGTF